MIPIVVLASGRGSNFDSIVQSIQKNELQAEIKAVVSDRSDSLVLLKAKKAGISAKVIPFPESKAGLGISDRRHIHEERILNEIQPLNPRFIVMAGYMRIVTPYFIESFRCDQGYSRIINIHPSLLPAFPGREAYSQAYRYGAQLAGVTVHLVELDLDQGPICAQESFSIADCRSESEVELRGLALEHQLFPQTLSWVLPEDFFVERRSIDGIEGRLCVRTN